MSPKEGLYNKTILQSVFFLIFIIAFFFLSLSDCLLLVSFKAGSSALLSLSLTFCPVSRKHAHSVKNPDSYKVSFPANDFQTIYCHVLEEKKRLRFCFGALRNFMEILSCKSPT